MIRKVKREGESNESLIRSFTRAVRSSGLQNDVKAHQIHQREPNKNQKKKAAQRRRVTREQREFDIKTGKIVENPRFRRS